MSAEFVAIIPIKRLTEGKSRLAPIFRKLQRKRIVKSVFEIVLREVLKSNFKKVWIISNDNLIKAKYGSISRVELLFDEHYDLNTTLQAKFRIAALQSLVPVYLPGDLPLITSNDINNILQKSLGGRNLTIIPDRKWKGTNCLVVPKHLVEDFVPLLGKLSYYSHLSQAKLNSWPITTFEVFSVSNDLDTVEDLKIISKYL